MVRLFPTSIRSVENHERACHLLETTDWTRNHQVTFQPFGLGIYAGASTRGKTKLLALCTDSSWEAFCADCDARFSAQHVDENRSQCRVWHAPLVLDDAVELFAAVHGSPFATRLLRRAEALRESDIRRRYLIAKEHGAGYDERVYREVKSLFWKTYETPSPKWEQPRQPILKLLREDEWQALLRDKETQGAPIDQQDGFIHFSTPLQVEETFQKYFADDNRVWLVTFDGADLGPALRFEPSRNKDLFPHLYAPLRLADVYLARPWGGVGFGVSTDDDGNL